MINNVVLVGRLTKDPDLRYTGNGTAVAAFTMAVERSFNAQSEQRQQAPAGNGNYGSPSTPPNQNGYSNQNNGYSNNQNGGMPSFARGASPIDISDDDLPF